MVGEMRVRKTVDSRNIKIDPAMVQSVKAQMTADALRAKLKAADDEKVKQMDLAPKSVAYYMSRLKNINHNFKKQSAHIQELENKINQVPDSGNPMETLENRINLQKEKMKAEIDRLETALIFQDFKKEADEFIKLIKQSKK